MIEAAPLERVVDLPGAIGRDDHDRRMRGFHGAELRDRHLEIGQHFEQERFERFVGAVELVDEQHRRPGDVRLQRLQQRPFDQKFLGEYVLRQMLAVLDAFGFGEPDRDHLRAVVPLVNRGGDIQSLVALQADQFPPERLRQHLGDFGLAHPGLALQKQRPPHAQSEEQHGRKRAVGEIIGLGEQRQGRVDRARKIVRFVLLHFSSLRKGRQEFLPAGIIGNIGSKAVRPNPGPPGLTPPRRQPRGARARRSDAPDIPRCRECRC